MGNQFRTAILLAALTAVILWFGNMFGGKQGMIIALLIAAGMNVFSYWYSDKIVLSMYRAREVTPDQAPEVYEMVRELAARARLPMPRVYLIPQESPNAFATGRNPEHAVVAVTEGLLRLMSREEIRGVLAHELSHIKDRDILIGTIAATLAGAIMVLASMARWSAIFRGGDSREGGMGIVGLIAMSILAPIAAMMIQMAVSRSREYLADTEGAELAQDPDALASALEKLAGYSKRAPMDAKPSTAHMFIVNPLSGQRMASLFSTHPPVEERIARLRGVRPSSSRPSSNQDRRAAEGKAFWDHLKR